MIVDDPECLRTWLTAVLRPLCDADPAALAKYVLALIKKDKTDEELKQGMVDQLDVFLQNETKGFVEVLFKVLATKEYMPASESVGSEASLMSSSSTSSAASKSATSTSGTSGVSAASVDTSKSGSSKTQRETNTSDSHSTSNEDSIISIAASDDRSNIFRREIKKEDDKDRERDRGRRNKSRSPHRSNSKSRERGRRSRSPREYRSRHRGRKSPIRRYDRPERDIWDRRRSPPARNRSASPRTRSRTPPRYRRPYNSRSNSRSRSPVIPRSPVRDAKESVQPPAPPRFADPRVQETVDIKPTISSVMRPTTVGPKVPEGYTTVPPIGLPGPGNRCRDFDERGLCMRGELCPYDHGCNPVVLEDVAGQNPIKQPGAEVELVNDRGEYRINEPIMYPPGMIRPPRPILCSEDERMEPPPHGWIGPAYRPRHNARGRGGTIRHGYMGPPRELISVPVLGASPPQGMMMEEYPQIPMPPPMPQRGMHVRGMHMGRGRGGGRGSFDHGRLGSKSYRANTNCSLEVKRIPRELNNIMDLNSHFWRFGKIVNIQINFESDPEAALITFSTPVEAYSAYRSTEAVLNNRFVKVFWHNKEKENEESETFQQGPMTVRDRLGTTEMQGEAMEQDKILVSGNNLTKTVYNPNAIKKELAQEKVEAVEAIKRSQEMLAAQESLKREQAEKKKEAMIMRSNLQKRKQDVLAEQIEQQKKLIQKVEAGKGVMKPEEIDQLMLIVKSLQESIESIKLDLDKTSNSLQPVQNPHSQHPVPSKNKDETQKEILDAELDLYNKELEGGDTLALKRKVLELRSQAQAAGLLRGRGGYRGLLRSFTNRGRGAMRSLRRVDRRPTKICITGYPTAKSSEILAHFAQYGLIENYDTDACTPSLTIKYESRKSAEVAMSQGRVVQHIPLDIQWVANPVVDPADQQAKHSSNGEGSRQEEMDNSNSLEEEEELGDLYVDQLDLYDNFEEEEDEEDERSWRR